MTRSKPRGARKAGPTRTDKTRRKERAPAPAAKKRAAQLRPELPSKPSRPKPITARRARLLLDLEAALSRRIVGKDDAVARIARVVRVRMTQLDFRPERPNGSFLLIGPPGVGKNELAYALAEVLLGREERVVSIDLGELTEEGNLAKLGVTLVPGSTSQALEGLLTSPVRRDPEAVVLLRGLERAHAAFQPVLQQILERGSLEDMLGPVSFSQTVVFVTARPRREESAAAEIGFSRASMPPEEALRKRLDRTFAPDLLDSFNEIIELPALTPEDVRRIARYKVEVVLKRLHRRHQEIEVAENVFEAFIPDSEARLDGTSLLNRTLEDRLFNPLARYLLGHRGHHPIRVEMVEGSLQIRE